MGRLTRIRTMGLGALLIGGMAAGGLGVVMAQDDEVPAYPANVLAGTCDDLDPVSVAELSYVSVLMNEGDDADNTPKGVLTAQRVLLSSSEGVELSMEDDLFASAHSIVISQSDADISTYVACGEIGGIPVDGDLYVGLRDVNGSGYSGVAKLDEDGDSTNIDIFLLEPTDESAPATPVS